jgi:selenocysteine lyase/cysteine desulfurase
MIDNQEIIQIRAELENSITKALQTYSNVHRGSGYKSIITTHLFEKARTIILDHFELNNGRYKVIFCPPRTASFITNACKTKDYKIISSDEIGLSLGIRALAVKKHALPKGIPFLTGGGTTRLVSRDWVVWAKSPDRFEAGTPSIINIIAFAQALLLTKKYGHDIFKSSQHSSLIVKELLYNDDLIKFSGTSLLKELRKTLVGQDIKTPTSFGNKAFINLDSSASTPTFEPIMKVALQCLILPQSIKKQIRSEVKLLCSKHLNASPTDYDIIFTSNTTESINLVAESINMKNDGNTIIINSLLEHSSNELPWRTVSDRSPIRLSVSNEGIIDLNELESILISYNEERKHGSKRVKLVALSGASNVLGICNNLHEISRIAHKYDARFLVDAAQLVAHRKIDMDAEGIDFLAFSAHKIYSPFGCGLLVTRKGFLNFSDKELNTIVSSGNENTFGIAALGKSLNLLQRIGMDVIKKDEQELTTYALNTMSKIPGIEIFGINDSSSENYDRKLGVILFSIKGIMADGIAKRLAFDGGIGVRYGCHCAHIIIKHLLKIGPGLEKFQRLIVTVFPKVNLPGLTRVSFGLENTNKDVDNLINTLEKIATNPKGKSVNKKAESITFSKSEVNKKLKEKISEIESIVY